MLNARSDKSVGQSFITHDSAINIESLKSHSIRNGREGSRLSQFKREGSRLSEKGCQGKICKGCSLM